MGYVDENLTAGEVVLYRARLHSIVLFWPILVGVLFGLPAVTGIIVSATDAAWAEPLGTNVFMLAVALFSVTYGFLRRSGTEMAVTNRRVIAKTGVLKRRTIELLLQKVESVGVEQGVLGRMSGYGDLVVRGTGGTAERFRSVENPLDLRQCVQEQVEQVHGEVSAARQQPSLTPTPAVAGRFCPHCGAPQSGEGQFCSACGRRRAG